MLLFFVGGLIYFYAFREPAYIPTPDEEGYEIENNINTND